MKKYTIRRINYIVKQSESENLKLKDLKYLSKVTFIRVITLRLWRNKTGHLEKKSGHQQFARPLRASIS